MRGRKEKIYDEYKQMSKYYLLIVYLKNNVNKIIADTGYLSEALRSSLVSVMVQK